MSNAVQHKLTNERGASIIVALILFLVCAMVAAVIVSGASVNAERAAQEVAEEQAYLDLRSAGQAVQTMFNPAAGAAGSEVSIDMSDPNNPIFHGNSLMQIGGKGDDVARWVAASAVLVYADPSHTAQYYDKDHTWDIDIVSTSPYTSKTTNTVKASFWMEPDYNIYVRLSLADSSDNNTQIQVSFTPTKDPTLSKWTWSRSDLYKVVE